MNIQSDFAVREFDFALWEKASVNEVSSTDK